MVLKYETADIVTWGEERDQDSKTLLSSSAIYFLYGSREAIPPVFAAATPITEQIMWQGFFRMCGSVHKLRLCNAWIQNEMGAFEQVGMLT